MPNKDLCYESQTIGLKGKNFGDHLAQPKMFSDFYKGSSLYNKLLINN